jgi:hypothetical protein
LAISLHYRDAVARLERPDEDPSANPRYLARNVQHVCAAIDEVYVGVPALEKERPVTRGHPAVGVPRGVANDIRFGLDDTAAGDAFGRLPHENLADEKASERDRVDRQLRSRERRMATLMATLMPVRFQPIRSIH